MVKKTIVGVIVLAVVLSAMLITCTSNVGRDTSMGETQELEPVEIGEYEGEKLSSISNFRDNSISDPQYIDIEDYKLEIAGLVNNPKNYTYNQLIDQN